MKKDIPSYNSLKDDQCNYLDVLSLKIIQTIKEMFSIDKTYKICKEKILKQNADGIYTVNAGFNQLKNFYWLQLCNQMRDYYSVLENLTGYSKWSDKNKQNKYKKITDYIKETKFLKIFLSTTDMNKNKVHEFDNKKYNALSFTLHNYNHYEFENKRSKSILEIYQNEFNKVLVDNNIKDITREFETVINYFRKIEDYKCSIGIGTNFSPIQSLIEYICGLIK